MWSREKAREKVPDTFPLTPFLPHLSSPPFLPPFLPFPTFPPTFPPSPFLPDTFPPLTPFLPFPPTFPPITTNLALHPTPGPRFTSRAADLKGGGPRCGSMDIQWGRRRERGGCRFNSGDRMAGTELRPASYINSKCVMTGRPLHSICVQVYFRVRQESPTKNPVHRPPSVWASAVKKRRGSAAAGDTHGGPDARQRFYLLLSV